MSKSFEFLKSCRVFFLTTINGEVPASRPFGAVMEYEGNLYISTGNTKDVYKQLIKNPNIQIVALKKETREWIRINGKAIETKDLKEKRIMLEECPILSKRFDSETCEYFALFKIIDMESYLCTDSGMSKIN
ncbi:NimC/NimA family protein [Clostridium botulinum]|nr:NimC/NimA family protein [Clostridium botulinum]